MSCGNCKYFQEQGGEEANPHGTPASVGTCRFESPTVFYAGEPGRNASAWPGVYASQWCADHVERVEPGKVPAERPKWEALFWSVAALLVLTTFVAVLVRFGP